MRWVLIGSAHERRKMENNNYALVSADENGTTIAVKGEMNSETSHSVESGVLAIRAAHPRGKLSIDASVLEGISREGVNVFMRLRNNEHNMSVRNTKPEIYKTLRAHGLTHLIDIEKSSY